MSTNTHGYTYSSFRPLIRGLSISSEIDFAAQILPVEFPSPHPGIINFFSSVGERSRALLSFRPLIRGLSISSALWASDQKWWGVSVPSSGDYQFLPEKKIEVKQRAKFPSPHPGIINFFGTPPVLRRVLTGFRPLIRGLSISSRWLQITRLWYRCFRPLIRGLSISSGNLMIFLEIYYVSVPSSGDYQFLPSMDHLDQCS